MIDGSYWKIMTLLWTNAKLMNVLVNNNPENVGIEYYLRGLSRRHILDQAGINNETPLSWPVRKQPVSAVVSGIPISPTRWTRST